SERTSSEESGIPASRSRRKVGQRRARQDGTQLLGRASEAGRNGSGQSTRGAAPCPRLATVPGDQTHSALAGQVGPGPLEHNEDAIAEADQEEDVHEAPGGPRWESRQAQPTEVGHSRGPSDGGEVPFVAVTERDRRFSAQGAESVQRCGA